MDKRKMPPPNGPTYQISKWKKQVFMQDHINIFHKAFKYFAYPSLDEHGLLVYDLIMEYYDYSPKTAKCDVVHSWYNVWDSYEMSLNLIKPQIMAKTFDDKKIKQRIKDVFADKEYSVAHDTLKRIFPELFQEYMDQDWNGTHKVGHLYVRIEGSSGFVKSLLIPVAIPYEDSHNVTIRFFNLIAGNFWSNTIVKNTAQTSGSWRTLNDEEWTELTRGWETSLFIHIGKFDHGNNNVILRGKNNMSKIIYEKY